MFVTKTESSKAWPTSAVRRERDEDREERQDERDDAGDDRAEDEEQDDQRRRRPEEELALLQVLLGELREVLVEVSSPVIAASTPGSRVEPLDGVDDVADRVLVCAEPDEQGGRAAVLGEQPLLVVRGDDVGRAGLPKLVGERVHACGGRPRPSSKLDHDDLGRRLVRGVRRDRETLGDELLRALGVGLAVTSPSVVSASPSSTPAMTNATTTASSQRPTVRQGWRAQASAMDSVERLTAARS